MKVNYMNRKIWETTILVGYLLISDFFPVTNYRFGSADICNLSIIIPLFLVRSVRYIAMVEQ